MQNICHPGPTPQNIDTTIVIHFRIANMPQCKTLYVICIKMQLSLKASASERIPRLLPRSTRVSKQYPAGNV
jgi:hypothetical protein